MMPTKIEWATDVWNPITGCSAISEGCKNCYAKRMANRLRGRYGYPKDDPFKVTFHPDRLNQPLKWKKPRMIFVCSMSDLFHPDVEWNWQYKIFEIMFVNPDHTYLVLTKRPEMMAHRLNDIYFHLQRNYDPECRYPNFLLKNLWLGVTAENQKRADERIPILLQIPAAVHFVSLEPLLEPMDIKKYLYCGIGWVIIGAESGPKKRFFSPKWAEGIISQCEKAKIPVFYKQDSNQKLPMVNGKRYTQFPDSTNKMSA